MTFMFRINAPWILSLITNSFMFDYVYRIWKFIVGYLVWIWKFIVGYLVWISPIGKYMYGLECLWRFNCVW